MVTAMHPLAAEAGLEVLRSAGGNAADAAIAAALALGVVEPFMSGLGGSAYAVAYDASRRISRSFDGSAAVPGVAREDLFELAPSGERRLGLYGWRATRDDASETGILSVAVPGALAALGELHAFLGTLPWRELVAPAVRLAREGFEVDEYLFTQSALSASRLRRFPETLAVFFNEDGTAMVPSSHDSEPQRLRQPVLAETLELLGREGPEAFYTGAAAEEIARFAGERGGILSVGDLASYRARESAPTSVPYRRSRIDTLPGASGGTTVAMALRILEGFDLAGLEMQSVERLHLVAETLRIVFTDRFSSLADPETESVPLDLLLSPGYAAERRRSIDPQGSRAREIPPGEAAGQHTTHVNVFDRERNVVALTATLGARFGSGVTVPSLGVVLNNGMMWFDPEPGRLNSIRPRKRALHAAAPCIGLEADRPRLALGAPGARRIMSSVLQVLLHVVDHGMGIQEAILAPRIHCEIGDDLEVDARLPSAVLEGLTARGYRPLVKRESFLSSYFGRPTGILVDDEGVLRGGVEPYRVSTAIGF